MEASNYKNVAVSRVRDFKGNNSDVESGVY